MSAVKKMELLAPAGSAEVLEAVIAAGCDSVYLSGKTFAMRQHARWLNFDPEGLERAVRTAHRRGVKVYITVNNLLTGTELGELREYLRFLASLEPDSLIVQDLGLIELTRELGIETPLHASTMMNVNSAHAARYLARLGISRIITSRDISVEAAAAIGREAGVEVEYFLHNDICAAQGSICYLSGMATESSSNRGQCIKPCRWQWDFVDAESGAALGKLSDQYLLARKDICLYHQLPELVTAGIDAVKIEGRARKAEYLEPIVRVYREAIDRYYESPYDYATDFEAFAELHRGRIRDWTTNLAFKDPGFEAAGPSGKREPRFFSIVAEEKGLHPELAEAFELEEPSAERWRTPRLHVRCGSAESAQVALESGADLVWVGGEFFSKTRRDPWAPDKLARLAEAASRGGKQLGLAAPRILGRREEFEFRRLLELSRELGVEHFLATSIGALELVREAVPGARILADYTLNIFNHLALEHLREQGVQSAVPAPELTFAQLDELARSGALPLECLAHGSLFGMVLESCLIAALMGKSTKQDPCHGHCTGRRFALRDRLGKDRLVVADQHCRNHLLMEKDLCVIEVLDRFFAIGAHALRIEAQHYDPGLTGALTALYRKHRDACAAAGPGREVQVSEADRERLRRISPRELGFGAYANRTVAVACAGESLPTEEVILYRPGGARDESMEGRDE